LLLKNQTQLLSIIIIILGISLAISTVDTLINAVSSLIIVDTKSLINYKKNVNYFKVSKFFIIFISLIAFIIASRGFSILYLFLLADLLCCAAVITVFAGFFKKKINDKTCYLSIIIGLITGFLLFPSPDFSKSILIGYLFPIEFFPSLISEFLLFWSFILATFTPIFAWQLR